MMLGPLFDFETSLITARALSAEWFVALAVDSLIVSQRPSTRSPQLHELVRRSRLLTMPVDHSPTRSRYSLDIMSRSASGSAEDHLLCGLRGDPAASCGVTGPRSRSVRVLLQFSRASRAPAARALLALSCRRCGFGVDGLPLTSSFSLRLRWNLQLPDDDRLDRGHLDSRTDGSPGVILVRRHRARPLAPPSASRGEMVLLAAGPRRPPKRFPLDICGQSLRNEVGRTICSYRGSARGPSSAAIVDSARGADQLAGDVLFVPRGTA